jgi:enamine deaminase RidA (YjgF/YER057c/UK114 family)
MKNLIYILSLFIGSVQLCVAQDYFLPVSSKSKTAISDYQKADQLVANANIVEGRKLLTNAIATDPNFFMAYVLQIYVASKEDAAGLIDKALAIDQSKFTNAEKIVREQLVVWDKDPDAKVGGNMKALVSAYPKTPQAYQWAYAHAAFTDNDDKSALDYCQRMIAIQPDYAPVYNTLGYVYMRNNEMGKAKTAFEKYMALAPKEANPYDSMADYFMATKEYGKAAEFYDKSVSMGMSSAKARADKARKMPEYFLLRPEVEKAFGYSHAVKIGNHITVSGAVSMDNAGSPTAIGDLDQQMKNCYSDLEKILKHYGCTFDDVYMENIFTTNMPQFLQISGYRNEIYKNHYPTGSWIGVKELALPEFMIEIELEVYKVD